MLHTKIWRGAGDGITLEFIHELPALAAGDWVGAEASLQAWPVPHAPVNPLPCSPLVSNIGDNGSCRPCRRFTGPRYSTCAEANSSPIKLNRKWPQVERRCWFFFFTHGQDESLELPPRDVQRNRQRLMVRPLGFSVNRGWGRKCRRLAARTLVADGPTRASSHPVSAEALGRKTHFGTWQYPYEYVGRAGRLDLAPGRPALLDLTVFSNEIASIGDAE